MKKKTYTVYAVTQPEQELLSNRYGSRTMPPTLYTSQLSLAVTVLVRWPIWALKTCTAPARNSQYKISHVHDVWRDYNSKGKWTIGEAKLKCISKLVSIPCWYFIPSYNVRDDFSQLHMELYWNCVQKSLCCGGSACPTCLVDFKLCCLADLS